MGDEGGGGYITLERSAHDLSNGGFVGIIICSVVLLWRRDMTISKRCNI